MNCSSTTHCHIRFLNSIHSHLDKRNTSLGVAFVYFRKAFDLVKQEQEQEQEQERKAGVGMVWNFEEIYFLQGVESLE